MASCEIEKAHATLVEWAFGIHQHNPLWLFLFVRFLLVVVLWWLIVLPIIRDHFYRLLWWSLITVLLLSKRTYARRA